MEWVITVAGVLDDGIPALRMYLKRDDRIGLSIPTTANTKAIIKQVKRALQVLYSACFCTIAAVFNFAKSL
jgi:hypothetical protein